MVFALRSDILLHLRQMRFAHAKSCVSILPRRNRPSPAASLSSNAKSRL
jgi:hypothetical protein